ncbi:hypothetical protein J41TS4_15070 [Paenibacillus apis]|uniref:Uncharacterized protein n=1 Tax=Paenibacillus apis TaxID=1792174 RepID=A0A919XZC0_9BACL|nr:hypothetical protein J41TS4_15070 [Paenibacillus apis]
MSSTTWIAYTMLALSGFIVIRSILKIINRSIANKDERHLTAKKLVLIIAATFVFLAVVVYLLVSR